MIRKLLPWLLVLCLLGAVIVGYDLAQTIDWIGGFPLEVNLESIGDHHVTRATAVTIPWIQSSDELQRDPSCLDIPLKEIEIRPDGSFKIEVTCSGKASGLGREYTYAQYRSLVLNLEYEDGHSHWIVAEIPDGRKERHLSIRVP